MFKPASPGEAPRPHGRILGVAGLGAALLILVASLLHALPLAASQDPRPSARHYHDMVYDSESDRIVLFGGWAGGQTDETWAYDPAANRWVQMNPSTAPSPRDAFAMAYDAQSDRVILFGGATPTGAAFGDTWIYDLNNDTWTNMIPVASPPPRFGARMVYEAGSDRVVLFGGHNGQIYGDTWLYDVDSNTWTEMTPTSSPSPRAWQAMAYDAESRRVVMFGGDFAVFTRFDDTWTYDLTNNTWTEMSPTQMPSPRSKVRAAYDLESDRTVLFGGDAADAGPGETWVYDANANAWTEQQINPRPSDRNVHTMAYVAASDLVILFGGSWPAGNFDDPTINRNNETWAYDFNANTWTPRDSLTLTGAPRNLAASPAGSAIELSWSAPSYDGGYAITDYRVYRGTTPADLTFFQEVADDPLLYADSQAEMATAYYYQVSAVTIAGESPPSEVVSATLPDTEDPTIAITSVEPGSGSLMALVSGTASDNVALEKVELSTDGTVWQQAAGTSTWSGIVSLECGDNAIYARATDTSGNTAEPAGSRQLHLDCPGPVPPVPWLLILGLVAAVGAGVTIALLLRRPRSRR